MSELGKDIAVGLATTLIVEQAPKFAKIIVSKSVQLLPEDHRERYERDWMTDLEYIEGNLSKLGAAFSIYFNAAKICIIEGGKHLDKVIEDMFISMLGFLSSALLAYYLISMLSQNKFDPHQAILSSFFSIMLIIETLAILGTFVIRPIRINISAVLKTGKFKALAFIIFLFILPKIVYKCTTFVIASFKDPNSDPLILLIEFLVAIIFYFVITRPLVGFLRRVTPKKIKNWI